MRENSKKFKWAFVALVCLSPLSIIPFINYPTLTGLNRQTIDAYSLVIGQIAGFIGVFMLLWQHILGNRFIVGFFTKNLSWTTRLHRQLATYGILFILLHPALMAYAYGFDLIFKFQLDSTVAFEKYLGFGRFALVIFLLIWVTSAVFRNKIGYRPWKYIHYLSYVMLPFVFIHADGISSTFAGSTVAQKIWLAIIIIFGTTLLIRLLWFFGLAQRRYKLIAKKEIMSGTFQYVFEPLKNGLEPEKGQFIYLRRSLLSEEHPFTVADFDQKTGTMTIISRVYGKYTSSLSKIKIDSTVRIDGPYGYFTQNMSNRRPTVLIAGGIGITPFLRHIFSGNVRHIFLFNCNTAIKRVVMRDKLKQALGKKYVDVISENSKGQNIETGYISTEIIHKYIKMDLKKIDYFICGPPGLIKSITDQLLAEGIPANQIHSEKFSF